MVAKIAVKRAAKEQMIAKSNGIAAIGVLRGYIETIIDKEIEQLAVADIALDARQELAKRLRNVTTEMNEAIARMVEGATEEAEAIMDKLRIKQSEIEEQIYAKLDGL